MKYRYETDTVNPKTYKVVETNTDTVIKFKMAFDPARKLAKHLNNNGGFAGFTPTFFNHNLIAALTT